MAAAFINLLPLQYDNLCPNGGRPHLLGIGLFEKRSPEFVGVSRVHEHQFVIVCREAIVDEDINPFAILPELEVEDAGVLAIAKGLVTRHHTVQEFLVLAEGRNSSKQPTVTCRGNNGTDV